MYDVHFNYEDALIMSRLLHLTYMQ